MDYAERFKQELDYIKQWGIPDPLLVAWVVHDCVMHQASKELYEGECELRGIGLHIKSSGGMSEKGGMELEARIGELIEERKELLDLQKKAARYSRKVTALRANITTPEQYSS